MTRFDEVTRLQELEKKATPTPWYYGVHPDNCDTCEDCDPSDTMCDNHIKPDFGPVAMISSGDVVPGIFASVVFGAEDNPNGQTIAGFRNAAPWFLEIAACFQPGDARIFKGILRYLTEDFENGEYSNEMVMFLMEGTDMRTDMVKTLLRMLKAAEIMEELE